jgi:hypothetical protein
VSGKDEQKACSQDCCGSGKQKYHRGNGGRTTRHRNWRRWCPNNRGPEKILGSKSYPDYISNYYGEYEDVYFGKFKDKEDSKIDKSDQFVTADARSIPKHRANFGYKNSRDEVIDSACCGGGFSDEENWFESGAYQNKDFD